MFSQDYKCIPEFSNWVDYWRAQKRVGIWFSTREAISDIRMHGENYVKEKLKNLLVLDPPDAIFVGAASGIVQDDQLRIIKIVEAARDQCNLSSSKVLILDWPSNPTHLACAGDASVVMSFLNTSSPEVNQARTMDAIFRLTQSGHPYFICGLLLFSNGGIDLPSVAEVGRIERPLNLKPYLAQPYVYASPLRFDLLFLDKGSAPSSGPFKRYFIDSIFDKEIQQKEHSYGVLVGGGISDTEEALEILEVSAVDAIAIGTIYERNPEKARDIIRTVRTIY